ncbi:zinc finger protein 777 [Aedes albopictus]|uniref:C2H2-type domain-containing protein n=1 Tax=Aedes albopictus TaxID=7160 RepID=A0ABM1Z624_AEDAL|nr:zinc finger protein 777-like [Aedes albopictus]
MSNVPCKNPLKYCRLCLSEDNELSVLESHESLTTIHSILLQKLFHYMKITFHKEQDYPSAICNGCMNRMNGFHDFRRLVVRNHNAVKTFRRLFGVQMEEEPPTVIEVIEDDDTDADAEPMEIKQEFEAEESKLADQIKTEHEQGAPPVKETVKDVDVYHLDGKLATVVVKEEQLSPVKEEKLSPVQSMPQMEKNPEQKRSPAAAKPTPNIINSKITILKRPQGRLLNMEHSEKRAKVVVGSEFSVVKCSQCRAVFRNRENLLIHERDDHRQPEQPKVNFKKIVTPPTTPHTRRISKPLPHTVATLFKCPHCSSSFIHKNNYELHQKTCKAAVLSKLNPQIVVKRTTPAAMNEVIKAAVAKVGRQVQIKPVETVIEIKQEPEGDDQRIRCQYCPLTYKTKYYLKKHLFDVHKIDDYENVFYCHVCKLNYSCDEDLQLHNRAIHRFLCKQCPEDFRTCMHAQTNAGRPGENGIVNKGM